MLTYIECGSCNGNGYNKCAVCNGDGEYEVLVCGHRGNCTCDTEVEPCECERGEIACEDCEGNGQMLTSEAGDTFSSYEDYKRYETTR